MKIKIYFLIIFLLPSSFIYSFSCDDIFFKGYIIKQENQIDNIEINFDSSLYLSFKDYFNSSEKRLKDLLIPFKIGDILKQDKIKEACYNLKKHFKKIDWVLEKINNKILVKIRLFSGIPDIVLYPYYYQFSKPESFFNSLLELASWQNFILEWEEKNFLYSLSHMDFFLDYQSPFLSGHVFFSYPIIRGLSISIILKKNYARKLILLKQKNIWAPYKYILQEDSIFSPAISYTFWGNLTLSLSFEFDFRREYSSYEFKKQEEIDLFLKTDKKHFFTHRISLRKKEYYNIFKSLKDRNPFLDGKTFSFIESHINLKTLKHFYSKNYLYFQLDIRYFIESYIFKNFYIQNEFHIKKNFNNHFDRKLNLAFPHDENIIIGMGDFLYRQVHSFYFLFLNDFIHIKLGDSFSQKLVIQLGFRLNFHFDFVENFQKENPKLSKIKTGLFHLYLGPFFRLSDFKLSAGVIITFHPEFDLTDPYSKNFAVFY